MNKKILGIDEAGRGPVLGPLVMAGVLITENKEQELQKLKVKDSKLLTPQQREKLYSEILEIITNYKIIILQPAQIDAAVKSSELNLNWLEAHTSAEILNELNPDKAIIDCPSTNIKAYKDYLYHLLKNKKISLQLEHNAEKHLPVAAASILAKVTRDRIIEDIKKRIGVNFGSGYMADELTKQFLEKYYEKHSDLFRKSWLSYKTVENKKHQKLLNNF